MSKALIDKAKIVCVFAHEAVGQRRKYTNEPYWHHPFEVAAIVEQYTDDADVICAAYLHDVIEDTEIQGEEIGIWFNRRIQRLVEEVTDVSTQADGNRARRKMLDKAHLAKASPEGQTIKLADLIHNTESIVRFDPNFARVYLEEKRALLGVLIKGNSDLYEQACISLTRSEESLGKTE